jgi:hypothetical protein
MAHFADIPRLAAPFAAAKAPPLLDRLIWGPIAAVAAIVALAPLAGLAVAWPTFALPGGAAAALLAGALFYRRVRPDERIAAALEGTAQLAMFAAVGAPLSYMAARAGLPLRDAWFDAADRALGFDWGALFGVMSAHPALHAVLNLAYLSFQPQATLAVLALAFTGRLSHLRIFVLAFVLTALITIAVSAVLPAEGAFSHYGLHPGEGTIMPVSHTSWPVFHGLRDGSLITLRASGSEGIITFPSLHAALGLIFALAFWPLPALRWIALAVNVLMVAGTPVEGSHYLVDVLAGLMIALACWVVARRLVRTIR